MAYQAFSSQGTQLQVSIASVFTTILGVKGLDGPDGETEEIDVSHLASTRREYILGLIEEGQIPFDLHWDPTEPAHVELFTAKNDRVARAQKIIFANAAASEMAFSGLMKKLSWTAQTGEAVMQKAAVRVTGAITLTV